MTEQEFLAHHGLTRNPFADEDAQTDIVFKEHCIANSFHPAWSKVFGDPREPSTAIVLGSKGSGKTAMRLQLAGEYAKHNQAHPDKRVFVVQYDDFNTYLGRIEHHMPSRYRGKPEKILQSIRLWDHMDAILCEGVTSLIDAIAPLQSTSRSDTITASQLAALDRGQRRDLMLLAACYDQSKTGTFRDRWKKTRRAVQYSNWSTWYECLGGIVGTILTLGILISLFQADSIAIQHVVWSSIILLPLMWAPYLWRWSRCGLRAWKIIHRVRVGRRDFFTLTQTLMSIPMKELAAQPLPTAPRTDDRYALIEKFQLILRTLGFHGLIVLIDRVDEPDLVNGLPDRMKQLVWPILDNKLLKHPGLGLKLLLPSELQYFLDREDREFQERARLDKQNVIRSFDWTGEALYDLVEARMKACSRDGQTQRPADLLDKSISEQRLLAAMQSLRTPRSLFRFLYRLVAEHCKTYRSSDPCFQVSTATFEATLAVFQSEVQRIG